MAGHIIKLCRQPLYRDGVLVARCQRPWGTEHDHSDKSIEKLVEQGKARYVRRSK